MKKVCMCGGELFGPVFKLGEISAIVSQDGQAHGTADQFGWQCLGCKRINQFKDHSPAAGEKVAANKGIIAGGEGIKVDDGERVLCNGFSTCTRDCHCKKPHRMDKCWYNTCYRRDHEDGMFRECYHEAACFDENFKPLKYIENEYVGNEDGTVTDKTTGLMWQEYGSIKAQYKEWGQEYIEELNQDKFASYNGWRLPTLVELTSLIERELTMNLFINPIFMQSQMECWSSDPHREGGAWTVDFRTGKVSWDDNKVYVRAVREVS